MARGELGRCGESPCVLGFAGEPTDRATGSVDRELGMTVNGLKLPDGFVALIGRPKPFYPLERERRPGSVDIQRR